MMMEMEDLDGSIRTTYLLFCRLDLWRVLEPGHCVFLPGLIAVILVGLAHQAMVLGAVHPVLVRDHKMKYLRNLLYLEGVNDVL